MKKKSLNILLLLLFISTPSFAAYDKNIQWETWDKGLYIDHYKVYWGTSSGVYINDSGPIPKNQTSYTVRGLEEGINYFYAVKAFDSNGFESNFSNEVTSFMVLEPNNGFLVNKANYSAVTFAGLGLANSSVEIFGTDTLNPIASTTVKGDGTWSVSVSLVGFSQGSIEVTIRHNGEERRVIGVYDTIAPKAPFSITTN